MSSGAVDRGRDRLRVLELYCGLGGCAAGLEPAVTAGVAEVVAAVDVNRLALDAYRHNFPHPVVAATVESLDADRLRRWDADLWWLSPPCQPFTRRGLRRDDGDPRAATFLAAIDRVAEVRPRYLALENVPGFRGSRVHGRLLEVLEGAGYRTVRERLLCPTELGVPNRRRRYYLVAARGELRIGRVGAAVAPAPLADHLDREPAPELAVDPELARRYRGALHVVRADDPGAVTTCFTSAYGRSPVRSGSYLDTGGGLRRFSPAEILRLLRFPRRYALPPELRLENGWRLAGNSLSVAAVRAVLSAVPELAPTLDPATPGSDAAGEPEVRPPRGCGRSSGRPPGSAG